MNCIIKITNTVIYNAGNAETFKRGELLALLIIWEGLSWFIGNKQTIKVNSFSKLLKCSYAIAYKLKIIRQKKFPMVCELNKNKTKFTFTSTS